MKRLKSLPIRYHIAAGGVMIAFMAITLYLMGQPLICPCGDVQLWHSGQGTESSMHMFDWYTWSHVIHGFLLYGLISWWFPDMPRMARITAAILPEAAWEIIENTPWMVEYYRMQTVSVEYLGDSVLNSVMDVVSMIGGAIYSRYLPIWSTVVLAILFELVALWAVRDNLTLNILMFLHPFEFIKEWQHLR